MKKKLLSLTVFIFLAASQTNFAKTKSPIQTKKVLDAPDTIKQPLFTGDALTVNDSTQMMTITGHASFKTEKFRTEDADRIIFDQKSNKVVVYGCKTFAIDGQ